MGIFKHFSKQIGSAIGVALVAAALLASAAMALTPAPEQTRESYTEQVEPICKKNTQTLESALKGVKAKIKKKKYKPAAAQFSKAANAFEKAIKDLRAVPQPSADTAKLGKWLKQLETGTKLLREMSKALKEGEKGKFSALSVRLTHNSNVANNYTLGFDFHSCRINSAKFT